MSTVLRKCIDITPNGVLQPWSLQDYRLIRVQPWWPKLRATTSWLRMWADWPTLQPQRAYAPDDPRSGGYGNLLAFDEQIKLAVADGLNVILMPYRYPLWANGNDKRPFNSDANVFHLPQDRVSFATYSRYVNAIGKPQEAAEKERVRNAEKSREYNLPPEGHGPDSAWAGYVDFLWQRYVTQAPKHGAVAAFEVVNEPNGQLWPQRGPSSDQSTLQGIFSVVGASFPVVEAVAEMMATMDSIADHHGQTMLCLAPSTSDADSANPRITTNITPTPYSANPGPFVDELLDELDRIGFRGGPRWAWSYHNYNDYELNQHRVEFLQEHLGKRWRGRRLDGCAELWCTEGGCRLTRVRQRFGANLNDEQVLNQQAEVIKEALHRHHWPQDEGAGVAMLTQYTVAADPRFDTGLLDPGYGHRPAFDAWCAIRERGAQGENVPADAPPPV
ncbi:MAG TPA: hypothetical protein VFN44_15705 [Solirubrobacteraceae bacterium]|nr:hypothetical protein [Solirubrobacteraceae bacterium]